MAVMIDLNADVGESFGAYRMGDEALFELLTSANIACGFHAGDPVTMEQTISKCIHHGISVGAHPGFNDLQGFGRRPVTMSITEVRTDVLYQIGALQAFVTAQGGTLSHVTPHGSLGNLAVVDEVYARGIVEAVLAFDPILPVVTQQGSLARIASAEGLPVAITAMADRAYNADGSLVSRQSPQAMVTDTRAVIDRVLSMVIDKKVQAIDGSILDIDATTVLLHGDTDEAVTLAAAIRSALITEGVTLAPLPEVLAAKKLRYA
ncbi:LamB/YcsF family protein [Brevibacterium linens]|uniref:LamB/YcsF family protein n=1 Tax=Brevibacterium linens TaxID=1703 RepID=UPI0035153E0E